MENTCWPENDSYVLKSIVKNKVLLIFQNYFYSNSKILSYLNLKYLHDKKLGYKEHERWVKTDPNLAVSKCHSV
jgi:hypothetical protein